MPKREPLDPVNNVPGMNTPGIKNPRAIDIVDQQDKTRKKSKERLNSQVLPTNASQVKPRNDAGVPYNERWNKGNQTSMRDAVTIRNNKSG